MMTLRSLLKLAIPVSLTQLSILLMQLVDTAFVGRLGPEAIGGISVGNAVFITLLVVGIGILAGLDFLISHAIGAARHEEANAFLLNGLYLATLISVPFLLLCIVLSDHFSWFGVAESISNQASRYLKVLAWSLWPTLLFTVMRQYLQASGVAFPVLLILIAANLVNAAANWVLVFGHLGAPAMGIAGSGWATFIARVFMFLAIVGYMFFFDRKIKGMLNKMSLSFSREHILKIIRLGVPAGAHMLFEVGVFTSATLLAGRLGALPLAAHQIVLQIASFTFMLPLGISSAASVLVAKSLGAGRHQQATRIGWTSFAVGAISMSVCGLTLYVFSHAILSIFTTDSSVIQLGSSLLLIAALFQISDGVQVVGSGVLRGLGDTRSAMVVNLAGHWIFGLPIGALLCFRYEMNVIGLWIGLSIGLTLVATSLVTIWRTKTALRS